MLPVGPAMRLEYHVSKWTWQTLSMMIRVTSKSWFCIRIDMVFLVCVSKNSEIIVCGLKEIAVVTGSRKMYWNWNSCWSGRHNDYSLGQVSINKHGQRTDTNPQSRGLKLVMKPVAIFVVKLSLSIGQSYIWNVQLLFPAMDSSCHLSVPGSSR